MSKMIQIPKGVLSYFYKNKVNLTNEVPKPYGPSNKSFIKY